MPPGLGLRPVVGRGRLGSTTRPACRPSLCFFCSLTTQESARARSRIARSRYQHIGRLSVVASARYATTDASAARRDLEDTLAELEKHAPNHVSLPRVQLALRSLQQEAGKESIRIAILGIANGHPGRTAKEVLRLLLADPLKAEEEWERELDKHDTAHPLVVRIGKQDAPDQEALRQSRTDLIREMQVSVPTLNGHNIEILVMETNPLTTNPRARAIQEFEESVLVPAVEIPTSDSGRVTPVATPVHKALIVADGMLGALAVSAMPLVDDKDEIAAAVNLRHPTDDVSSCPFMHIDIDLGAQGLGLFRDNVSNAMKYEACWYRSNIPDVRSWLTLGSLSSEDGATKLPVRKLVASVLQNALASIQAEEARHVSCARPALLSGPRLNARLADWAEGAHAELQQELDLVFSGRRWRKLGWWKLFWRVDDVTMLTSEMVTQRFLPRSEQEIVYLAGRLAESQSSDARDELPAYLQPSATADGTRQIVEAKWPTHISFTRRYLLDETIPALQALAQKLVLQTSSSSALSAALGGLMYLSSFGAYEAGAVTALGLVWSLGRMQKKWEAARDFWEGEVREEGRKTIRAAESSVAHYLDQAKEEYAQGGRAVEDLERARELVEKAEAALQKLP
ncbi:uncharacterized protein E0L32_001863 [Thyridium curvatum]|uniref:Mmc1 C-terminal domain-containing protein n=1 Tax=Thyridium curvatum TaxID=1093900 RepID=A0A507ATK4_9PEZI|nr:uncharacterized protein E0L32_001816 [Thyridium curvatum]XP_030989999.1 uncharacterized protein E0L32_001863 [Thyridium curvatum]TPX08241.1 hypothetical protein E0L32_001816 [Thyridium curvatum]TPX08288.1 hypothetical protein E0L32_001863 [Thyridium curvatum]